MIKDLNNKEIAGCIYNQELRKTKYIMFKKKRKKAASCILNGKDMLNHLIVVLISHLYHMYYHIKTEPIFS